MTLSTSTTRGNSGVETTQRVNEQVIADPSRPSISHDNQIDVTDDRPSLSGSPRWEQVFSDNLQRNGISGDLVSQIISGTNAEETRARQEEENRRKLARIANQEIAKAAKDRETNRAANARDAASLLESQRKMQQRVDQIAAEEIESAARSRQQARNEQTQASANQLAMEADVSQRLDDIAGEELANALASSRRASESQAARSERVNSDIDRRVDAAMQEIMDGIALREEEADKSKRAARIESDRIGRVAENEFLRNRINSTLFMNPGMGIAEAAARVLGIDRSVGDNTDEDADRQGTRDVFDNYVSYTNERISEQESARKREEETDRRDRIRESIDREAINDEPTKSWTDVTGAKTASERIDRIVESAYERHAGEYESVRNRDVIEQLKPNADIDDIASYLTENSSEPMFIRALNSAQNMMMKRFLNPFSLRVQGMGVQTKTRVVNGKKHTYAKIEYSERVTAAIGAVKRVYNCSDYNVMQLVQLRAGLGIGIDGTIANIDPDKFELTEDQFWELCTDIVLSQRENGHPLGPVRGVPGASGVRDDTGRFVVVAGTRCFPIGYMPKQLIRDLSADPNSPFYVMKMSERQIQTAIGSQWINQTYPQLLANTSGNLMFQARAIENMVRAMMAIDGVSPSELDIPEAQYNRTLMTMRAERETVDDPALRRANGIKHERMERESSRWYHRANKAGGARDGGSKLASAKDRRRNRLGDCARGISDMQKMARAANIFLWISSPLEAMQSMMDQKIANGIQDLFLYHGLHEAEMQNYKTTDRLDDVARSKSAKEALDVANSLYRIGGHPALTAFMETLDADDGRRKYQMTYADLRRFLQDSGITSGTTITDEIRQMFGIQPGQENAFIANAQGIMMGVENILLGSSDLFKESESRQFVRMSMSEMGRSKIRGRESYTSSEVEEWANISGEEMIRSLLMTDAGREAFMTQGVTSLARKSPTSNLVRRVMTWNGVTELAVRTMFDRFPEYGVAKIERQVPFSNTLSYLVSYGVSSNGDMLRMADANNQKVDAIVSAAGESMSRMRDYQMGGRLDFWEGLRKNLIYDTVMGLNKITMAAIYKGIIEMLGGIRRPPENGDRYNWSEWIIGGEDDENAMPIKWAWWMDDLSGIGLPLGVAWAIAKQGDYSPDAVAEASNVFINAIANLNSGSVLFDAISLVNDTERNVDDALGKNVEAEEPGCFERLRTNVELACWDFLGDMTPTIIGQIVPWSKDSLFRTDDNRHTGSYVYDTDKYTLEEAIAGNHTKYVDNWHDRQIRNAMRYNPFGALLADIGSMLAGKYDKGSSYRYTNMPIATMADDLYKASWDEFYLDLSDKNPDVPTDIDAKKKFTYEWAEHAIQEIMDRYDNPTQAAASGLVLNEYARAAIKAYCNHMIYDIIPDEKDSTIDDAYLKYGRGNIPDDEWDKIDDFYDSQYEYWNSIRNDWLGKDSPIPWSIPRYLQQESDTETRYVDDQQNPSNYLNYALPQSSRGALRNTIRSVSDLLGVGEYGDVLSNIISDDQASPQKYAYGNQQTVLPFSTPRTEDKAYNYETPTIWARTDKDGNLVADMQDIYDRTADMVAQSGRNRGKNLQELFYAGQGTNAGYQVDENGNPVLDDRGMLIPTTSDEELNLGANDVPTVGSSTDGRVWYALEEKIPDVIKKIMYGDEDTISEVLGFDISTKDSKKPEDDGDDTDTDASKSGSNRSYRGPRYYGGTRYYRSNYSGSGRSAYNPKIYSSTRQVYSQRAAGMSTRQPYKATTSYLRPGFYTKGSREAYKRSDI